MPQEKELDEQIRRIEQLVNECNAIPDLQTRRKVQELLRTVMELHGAALDKLMNLINEEAPTLVDTLGNDEQVGSLLILHGLHPIPLETRIHQALRRTEGIFRGYGAHVEMLGAPGGAVRLLVSGVVTSVHAKEVRRAIEESISEAAPDIESITIVGLEQFTPGNFVPLDQIAKASPSITMPAYAGEGGG